MVVTDCGVYSNYIMWQSCLWISPLWTHWF